MVALIFVSASALPVNLGKALRDAATEGDILEIRHLIDAGADIDSADKKGRSPLFFAVKTGRHEAVRLLLESGATPIIGSAELEKALRKAAEEDDAKKIETLLLAGVNVDAIDKNARTPLMRAIAKGQSAAARSLVRSGADRNARDKDGDSALDMALRRDDGRTMDAMEYGMAERAGTVEALEQFIADGAGYFDREARGTLRQIKTENEAWEDARRVDSIDVYETFLKQHEAGRHAPEAATRLKYWLEETARWRSMGSQPSESVYEAFLRDFPDSEHAEEASAWLEAFRADQDVIQARRDSTLEGWEAFLRRHPTSQHREEAGRRIEELGHDPLVDRLRAALGTLDMDAPFVVLLVQLSQTDAGDQIFIKSPKDYSYYSIGINGANVSAAAIEQPLLRYMKPSEVTVARLSWRTLFGDEQYLSDVLSWCLEHVAEFVGLDRATMKFVFISPEGGTLNFRALNRDLSLQQQLMVSSLSPDEMAFSIPRVNRKRRDWVLEWLERAKWSPSSPRDLVYVHGASGRWDDVVNMGEPALSPLVDVLKEGQPDIRIEAARALSRMNSRFESEELQGAVAALRKELAGHGTAAADAARLLVALGWRVPSSGEAIRLFTLLDGPALVQHCRGNRRRYGRAPG